MKVGILTSSRADYGIYQPLLNKLKNDSFFSLEIIVFGSHLSKSHGYTIDEIKSDKHQTIHEINSLLSTDNEQSTASSYGLTVLKFADFWQLNKYNLVFCLGDRYEMSAAVQAGIPFGVKFAHIHGGETTRGAIDDVYRHQISLASLIHFTSVNSYREKVVQVIGSKKNVYSIGSLSLDSLDSFVPIERELFFKTFKIIGESYALVTFHPETKAFKDNIFFSNEMGKALSNICKNLFVVITMPNADTQGFLYRDVIENLKKKYPNRFLLIENFGKYNYFSAMSHSKLILGNSSSGIIEAASFGKYVVNVGHRQGGRAQSENVINCNFEYEAIVSSTYKAVKSGNFNGLNIYHSQNVADKIIKIIKQFS